MLVYTSALNRRNGYGSWGDGTWSLHRLGIDDGPGQSGTQCLCPECHPTCLLDDCLVHRQRWTIDFDDILKKGLERPVEERRWIHTFSRSILASAPIRVSRMRLTIHFSPSSFERLSLSDKSLRTNENQLPWKENHI